MLFQLIGAFSLGVVLGWLVRYFLDRFEAFNTKVLGSIVAILCGGVVIQLIGADPFGQAVWLYPVGLLFGVLLYPAIAAFERFFQSVAPKRERHDLPNETRDSVHQASDSKPTNRE